jgi:hypothetical protein
MLLARKGLVELRESESCQDRHDICIVTEIKVQGLVERESFSVVIECSVNLRARVSESVVF